MRVQSEKMGECRGGGAGDGLIKLFGTTIPVPETTAADAAKDLQYNGGGSSSSSNTESSDEAKENTQQDGSDQSPQPEVVDAEDPNKLQQQHGGGGDEDDDKKAPGQQGKPTTMKKPDKVLPCPRCNSMDTKFCYFNNYNVNQPRHFCKNCQRYWTAGGAMRNVPVGAGRRKNKSAAAASQFLQRVRAALPAAAAGDPAVLRTNGGGTVLSFGHHHVDLAEPQQQHLVAKEKPLLVSIGSTTTGNNKSCSEGSSSTDDKNQSDKVEPAANNGVVHQQQYPTAANMWPYYPPPGIAIPIFPSTPAYWGCMVPTAGGWSLPWPAAPVQSPTTPAPQAGFSSPTCSAAPSSVSSGADSLSPLGKHARDGAEDGDGGRRSHHRGNGKVWAPKTIRIDDADEVAKCSIWSLIGTRGGGKHNTSTTVFEPKHEKTAKQAMITSSPLLHANPVALTRSLTFQEGA